MTESRRQRLRALLAVDHDAVSGSVLARLCVLTRSELAVSGAGVSLIDRPGGPNRLQRLAQASDPIGARLEDLQLTVGEGPGVDAVTSGAAVLVPNLTVAAPRWPAYAPGALAAGVSAVFAFPLALGSIRLGSLDCYRTTAGELTGLQVGSGLTLAELAFEAVISEIAEHAHDDLGWISDIHAEVHQASGIVMYEHGVSIHAALLRIRGYAYANSLPITEVARRIVERDLLLEEEE
ncbi:MAG TPA: ANTAR domain-containing protein [Actinophytocola sp.]|uniref:GAF and ANTAR domain-containing protein n=1 Tax=Actinophytocola sp. TaxID=1872138 RepID=UPI002F92F441